MFIRNFTDKLRWSILLLLISHSFFASAQKNNSNIFKSVHLDTTQIISSAEAQAIAATFQQRAYKKISGAEKIKLDKDLKQLDQTDTVKFKKAAYAISSVGVLLMGASAPSDLCIVYASAAAHALPDDAVAINNFGSVLRMLDSLKHSLKYFLYAKSLDGKSPLILTNLGNTFFELYDDRNAEVFYNRALKQDNHFALARQGMVAIYLKRKEPGKAYEELLKGVEEVAYSEGTQQAFDGLKNNDKAKEAASKSSAQGPPPPVSGSNSGGNASHNPGGNPDQLKLPPFPNWSDMKALINANGPKKWGDDMTKKSIAAQEKMMNDAKSSAGKYKAILKLSRDEQVKAMDLIKKNPMAALAKKNQLAMELMQEHISIQLDKVMHDYNKADSVASAKMNKSVEQISLIYEDKIKAIAKHSEATMQSVAPIMEKAAVGEKISEGEATKVGEASAEALKEAGPSGQTAKLMIERCHKIKRVIEDYFGEWKPLAKIKHDKTMDLLSEYWIYCEQYLNQTYDKDVFNLMSGSRELFVINQVRLLPSEYGIRQFEFNVVLMSAMTGPDGNCPEEPTPPVVSSSEDTKTDVPKSNAPPCPFEGHKAKVGLGPVSIALDCESIELDYTEGVSVAGKWNFKKKETTLFMGVGVKAEFGIIKLGEISFKEGMSMTFDRNGQPTNIAIVQEVGGQLNIGGSSVGGSANMTLGATTGINTELTKEYAYSR